MIVWNLPVNPLPNVKILDVTKFKPCADDKLTLSQTTNFRLFKLKDDDSKCDESGRKLSKWVENTMGKGEIAYYEQFLHFPQCFQKTCTAGLVWERIKYC